MHMSNDEIVVRYRQAKEKGKQLNILAELNACSVDDIVNVLVEHGGYQLERMSRSRCKARLLKEEEEAPAKELVKAAEAIKDFDAALTKGQELEKQIPYKKPEIISGPPEPVTLDQALNVLHEEIAKITQQQEELAKRKIAIFDKIWKALGVTVQPIQAAPESTIALYNGRSDENESN